MSLLLCIHLRLQGLKACLHSLLLLLHASDLLSESLDLVSIFITELQMLHELGLNLLQSDLRRRDDCQFIGHAALQGRNLLLEIAALLVRMRIHLFEALVGLKDLLKLGLRVLQIHQIFLLELVELPLQILVVRLQVLPVSQQVVELLHGCFGVLLENEDL